jgi:hypothetical protein
MEKFSMALRAGLWLQIIQRQRSVVAAVAERIGAIARKS